MKIIIENTRFDYNIGCRLLKTKYRNVPFKGLEDIWEDIVPITFKEITKELENIEQRRIAIGCLGLENIYKEVNPKLVSSKTISKETFWVGENGELIKNNFEDTYELYEVKGNVWGEGSDFGWRKPEDVYFVKCKDTSTDREFIVLTTLTNGCQVVPISVKRLTQFKQLRGQFKQTSKKVVLRKLFVKVIVFLSKRKRIVKEVRLDT